MSKIRIYELARELSVDNRIVIAKAIELGLAGKSSHSNSLDADEADQIRRAIIRQAIGTAPEKEVVTTRVDKLSGATNTIVEKRKGDVIRRRRQSPSGGGSSTEAAEDTTQITVENVFSSGDIVEGGQQPHAPIIQESEEEPQPVIEEESPHEGFLTREVSVESSEGVSDRLSKGATNGQALSREEKLEDALKVAEPAVVEEKQKGPGPKVLGKIELPQKKAPRPEPKKQVEAVPATAHRPEAGFGAEQEEEGEDWKDSKDKDARKRRTRKREISRLELIDYDGGDARRGPRTARAGRNAKVEREEKKQSQTEITTPKASKRVVKMDESITVGELAKQLSLKSGEIISKLIQLGVMATINQSIDQDTATVIAEEFGYQLESTSFDEKIILESDIADDPDALVPRPPVVTVMGHVDHGKTSLLDAIRSASVAAREHGGITQHIGAYKVTLDDGRSISFIDTPGHAAFTAMRARGAQVTDIVVLVVAADDGVMAQTLEAVNHAKAAGVSIIVAINKMDKGDANPDRVKQQLIEHGLQPEDWGGDTMYFPVSALKKQGIKELLEGILLLAEVKELRANPNRRARGTIVEARQDRGRGTVATVLVQNGTLRVGDIFVTGAEYGRVRFLVDHEGQKLEEAGPSTPVEIAGLSGVPQAGDDFFVTESEAQARDVAQNRAQKKLISEQRALAGGPISLEEFARRANFDEVLELNVILKADVHGSVEAAKEAIEKLSNQKVKVRVLHSGVGGINESDVQLATASRAIIVGFGVRAEPRVVAEADAKAVQLRFYRIIYELIDDVKQAMAGLLPPVQEEVSLGRVEVREIFAIPKIGTVAGCYVADGLVKRGAMLRLLRDSRVVHEGKMSGLRRFKDDVREVQSGYECGISIDGFNDVKMGDVIEVFEIKESAATLD